MIWIVGAKGMLGREVSGELSREGIQTVETDIDLDFTDYPAVESFAVRHKPEWIVNCAAYTAVDRAESEPDKAFGLNVTGPKDLARAAEKTGAALIHISTDYVFGSAGGNAAEGVSGAALSEGDDTMPESVYGETKLAGELAVAEETDRYVILRTAWLYGQYGNNFVSTMLRLFRDKGAAKVVDDQWGCPTWAGDLAGAVRLVIETGSPLPEAEEAARYGTYHYCGSGRTSWYGFAGGISEIAFEYGMMNRLPQITPCTADEYPTAAKRPAWSVLSTIKFEQTFHCKIPDWRESLRKYLRQISEKQGN